MSQKITKKEILTTIKAGTRPNQYRGGKNDAGTATPSAEILQQLFQRATGLWDGESAQRREGADSKAVCGLGESSEDTEEAAHHEGVQEAGKAQHGGRDADVRAMVSGAAADACVCAKTRTGKQMEGRDEDDRRTA